MRMMPLLVAILAINGCDAPTTTSPGALAYGDEDNEIRTVRATHKPWQFGGIEGRVIVTPHYRLYTTVRDPGLLDRMPVFLERSLDHYASSLAALPQPRARLETFLFETRSQWEAKTRQMLPEQATRFLTLGRGGFTTRGISVLYYIGRRDTLAIAAHEGWHQYAQRTLNEPLPIWLEEGIATYMEGYVTSPNGLPTFRPWANLERYHTLRDAVRRDRLIPLSRILEERPEAILASGKNRLLTYYSEVWALAHFLVEGEDGRYEQALQQMLVDATTGRSERYRRAAQGRVGPGVLLAYLDVDLETFEAQYLDFVRRITRTGGRDRIVQGRSPLS